MPEPRPTRQLPLPLSPTLVSADSDYQAGCPADRPTRPARRPAVLLVRFACHGPGGPGDLRSALARALTGGPRQLPLAPARPPAPSPPSPSPCLPCPRRASCRAPCAALEALLEPVAVAPRAEVSSPVLMAGGGRDPQFMVQHAALAIVPDLDRLSRRYGSRLRAALPLLTPVQREVIEHLLAGLSRTDVARLRGIARQNVHKDYHAALRALRRALEGP